ncbi:putative F-box protein-like [Capsicum annuum]|nr:putative F-box protein-like [Capsicum annuum]KAF3647625.1 putative F-box protein-like [Capsicum annuum]
MRILTSPFPIFPPHSKPTISRTKYHQCRVSIKPPPSNFDFKNEFFSASRDAIEEAQPGLLDLADNGTLFLIKKSQFGPVPPWRSDFVEPEAIWLIGTYHLSMESAVDVERVIRAVRPENVVVELCRSRQVAIPEQNLKLLIPALRFILIKTNFSPTLTLCLEGYHVASPVITSGEATMMGGEADRRCGGRRIHGGVVRRSGGGREEAVQLTADSDMNAINQHAKIGLHQNPVGLRDYGASRQGSNPKLSISSISSRYHYIAKKILLSQEAKTLAQEIKANSENLSKNFKNLDFQIGLTSSNSRHVDLMITSYCLSLKFSLSNRTQFSSIDFKTVRHNHSAQYETQLVPSDFWNVRYSHPAPYNT